MSHCNLIAPCYFRLSIFRIVFCHSPYGRRVQCVVEGKILISSVLKGNTDVLPPSIVSDSGW
ncbi:hypothetical protein RaK2_00220 [Klebsiella phage vB_KleM_RaK2]|uniref:Uncharacterized protein n=1 Tax=Klebsiella phage vB_KleM_RaK2 TaxID=1147094 RepID=H6X427_9CAUD|nr:hypothetical protein F403_gp315 [Klebsiella phage vB_KleM_RaK2]AFA44493.1 hypothetical protein RaK2_00220 [Klebsiella phage vB_KleM_RaK2]